MDDQQRAREFLERFQRLEDTPPELVLMSCDRVLEAITAALRAEPEITDDAVERAAKALHANGADSITSDTPWSELHDGELNQFRSWARAALVAARPQGVKDV